MKLHELKPNPGARKQKIRRGRGDGSGYGSFSGRGCKGQKARSGGSIRPGFEGGQTPFLQRMPKLRGFTNPSRMEYAPINLTILEERYAEKETVSPQTLKEKRLVRGNALHVKILGSGSLSKKLSFQGVYFSASAKEKITKSGGTIEEAPPNSKE